MSFFNRKVFVVVLSAACYGQNVDSINVFASEIRGSAHDAQSVELVDSVTQNLAGRSMVERDGSFVLRDVNPGSYIVRVVPNATGRNSHPQDVFVHVGDVGKTGSTPVQGTVSAENLAKPPSKAALKFLNKAQKLSEAGESVKAIEVLRNAPIDSAGAPYLHSRLGTEYLKAGQFALAAPELEQAALLMPKEPVHHSNLAYVYQALGQHEKAEKEARLALQLDHSNAKAHFLLGSILLDRPSGIQEATANLKLAREQVPSARFLLAQVYFLSGQKEAGQREIGDFLSVASEAQLSAARQWISLHSRPINQDSESAK